MGEAGSEEAVRPALMRRVLGAAFPVTRQAAREALLAGAGGTLAIGVLAACAAAATTPLIIAPFGASCVLLFTVPASPLAQPRNVVGGHMISAIVGLIVVALLGPSPFAMAVGVGLAIFAMRLTGTVHPPAGANPIVVVLTGAHWWFFTLPAGLGATMLVLVAMLCHRAVTKAPYPAAAG